jgi:hypothetical protein
MMRGPQDEGATMVEFRQGFRLEGWANPPALARPAEPRRAIRSRSMGGMSIGNS